MFALLTGLQLMMGLAACGLVIIVAAERLPLRSAAILGGAWYLFMLAPLLLVSRASSIAKHKNSWQLLHTSLDFAQAAPFLLSLAAVFVVIAQMQRKTALKPAVCWREVRMSRAGIALAAIVLGWTGWLVAAEGTLNEFSATILANTATATGFSLATGLIVQLIRTRVVTLQHTTVSVLAGLAAATAIGAYVSIPTAVGVGVIGGFVAASLATRRGRLDESLGCVVASGVGTGALVGLLALGLLDRNAGFFFTGQPGQTLAQLVLVLTSTIYPALLGIGVLAALQIASKRSAMWAIPDSNR